MEKRTTGVLEQFETVIATIEEDEIACGLLDRVLALAEDCFVTVIKIETRLKLARLRMDDRDLRNLEESLEGERTHIFENLAAAIRTLNSYIFENFKDRIPDGGILSEGPEAVNDYGEVAEWAGDLLTAVYQKRIR